MPDLSTIDGTVDVYCIDDFLPNMPTVRGNVALVHRLIRRLTTRRGQLPFWPDDGLDVRDYLLSKRRPEDAAEEVLDEILKDEQVQRDGTRVSAELLDSGKQLKLDFEVAAGGPPFTFTLLIADAAVSLINLQKNA